MAKRMFSAPTVNVESELILDLEVQLLTIQTTLYPTKHPRADYTVRLFDRSYTDISDISQALKDYSEHLKESLKPILGVQLNYRGY